MSLKNECVDHVPFSPALGQQRLALLQDFAQIGNLYFPLSTNLQLDISFGLYSL